MFVLSEDELDGINHAFLLPAEHIYARDEIETGLNDAPVSFAQTVETGGMRFTYAARDKLMIFFGDVSLEVDFGGEQTLGADLFVDASESLQFTMRDGIIYL